MGYFIQMKLIAKHTNLCTLKTNNLGIVFSIFKSNLARTLP